MTTLAEPHRFAALVARIATARAGNIGLVLTLLLIVASIPTGVLVHQVVGNLAQAAIDVPFALVGWAVVRHAPRNPIGWMVLVIPFGLTLSEVAGDYAVLAFRQGHANLPLARLAIATTNSWIVLLFLLPVPLLIFPDGRWPGGFWRVTIWAYLAITVATVGSLVIGVVPAFTEAHPQVDSSGELVSQDHSSQLVGATLFLSIALITLSWAGRLFVGFHRASGDTRQQHKWLLSGAAIALIGFGTSVIFSGSHDIAAQIAGALGYIATMALPVGLAIGILRYRLYEIDRLISRTVSYAIVTGLGAGVYVGLVALTTRVVRLSSPVAVTTATLAAVAIFSPLRTRIQHLVDRRFNRTRYRGDAIVAAFRTSLHHEYELDDVRLRLISTVRQALEPRDASLWLRPTGER